MGEKKGWFEKGQKLIPSPVQAKENPLRAREKEKTLMLKREIGCMRESKAENLPAKPQWAKRDLGVGRIFRKRKILKGVFNPWA